MKNYIFYISIIIFINISCISVAVSQTTMETKKDSIMPNGFRYISPEELQRINSKLRDSFDKIYDEIEAGVLPAPGGAEKDWIYEEEISSSSNDVVDDSKSISEEERLKIIEHFSTQNENLYQVQRNDPGGYDEPDDWVDTNDNNNVPTEQSKSENNPITVEITDTDEESETIKKTDSNNNESVTTDYTNTTIDEEIFVTICATAKPSITGGSEFKRRKFTITGKEPQKITVTTPAANFAIVSKQGRIAYQVIDGIAWGSLILEPNTYFLSCSGGGAMGLMSATVCINVPNIGENPSQDIPTISNGSDDEGSVKPINKPNLPKGPIVRIVLHNKNNDNKALILKVGEEMKFNVVWGEDAVGNKISVTGEKWKIVGDSNVGSISNDGVFKAKSNGIVSVVATIQNEEGDDISGSSSITITNREPITIDGVLGFQDEKGNDMIWPSSGYKIKCIYGSKPNKIELFTDTNNKGEFKFVIPFWDEDIKAKVILKQIIPAPQNYIWQYKNQFMTGLKEGWRWEFVWDMKLKEELKYIEGYIAHNGVPIDGASIELADKNGNIIDQNGVDVSDIKEREKIYSNYNGSYSFPLSNSLAGRYKLVVKSVGGHVTLHNSLINKKDIWIDIPISSESRTINIELISWAEKIGYTGP